MSTVAFGNVPPFFTSFPYGPVPSSGTASTKFVDLFNAQTVAGAKTWTGTTTFNKPAQTGAAETGWIFKTTDDATGKMEAMNASASDGLFIGMLRFTSSSTNTGGLIRSLITTDTGALPATYFDVATVGGAAIATRPLYSFRNNNTEFAQISAAGGFVISGGSAPSIKVGASGTALTQMRAYAPSLTPASVAANTSAEQTFTVTGLSTGDKVYLNSPASLGDGLAIVGVRVSAADTLAIRFANLTAGSLTPVSGTYPVVAIRS